jgi:hypothetical protein
VQKARVFSSWFFLIEPVETFGMCLMLPQKAQGMLQTRGSQGDESPTFQVFWKSLNGFISKVKPKIKDP